MLQFLSVDNVIITVFLGLLALAAYFDVREYRIPNRLSLFIAALYPVHVVASAQPVDWVGGLVVAAIVLAVLLALYAFRAVGGGDVKLLTVTAMWAGPAAMAEFLVITTLAGGLLALLMISSARFGFAVGLAGIGRRGPKSMVLKEALPYGVAIAAGGFFVGGLLLIR